MNEPKSPRDWLLARQARAEPQLDALRRDALPRSSKVWRTILAELFRPHRHLWQALACLWLGMAVFHLATRTSRPAQPTEAPSAAAVAQWFAQLKTHDTFAQIDRRP